MRSTFIRFSFLVGLIALLFIATGSHCHSDHHHDPYYDGPTFDLIIQNNESVAVDVYVNGTFQDTILPYSELVLVDVPESIDTQLYAEVTGGTGTWGPDFVDTLYRYSYTWVIDPLEFFTLTVINDDFWVGCDVFVDDQYVGSAPANSTVSFTGLATSLNTQVDIEAIDLSWIYGPDFYDTTDTGSGFAGELIIPVP